MTIFRSKNGPSVVQIAADYAEEDNGTYTIMITISGLPHMEAVQQMSTWARDSLFEATPKIKGFVRNIEDDQQGLQ